MTGSRQVGRRRLISCPIFGLTLGALIAGGAAAAPVLPTGGKVVAGSAVIGAPGSGVLTVTQSSSKAILDWSSFSIGAGGKVVFDNGSGATLNRVTGTAVSSLDGLLSATGSVYLINPNGVIIGRSGVVDVGGAFVASTLDTPDASFLKGGALGFTGASNAKVVNLGKVGALGGDVALIAAQVSNAGSVSAANGSAALIAGHSLVMLRDGALDEGRFSVLLGGAGTSVANTGVIEAADAELRAEGGNIYALAGDTAGVIRATGVKSGGGKVWLVAEGGELDLGGAITAQGRGGTAGAIETSGGTVKVGDARIDAHGGTWLIDPNDLTIDSAAATTIDNALNAGTSVTEQTTASGYSGAGVVSTSGKGDITVAAPISWNTSAGLSLSAYRNIDINAQVTASGGGALTLVSDNSGAGNGGTLLFNGGSVQFTGVSGSQPNGLLAIGVGTGAPTSYTLVSDLQTLSNDIAANNSGAFALAKPINVGGISYSTIPLVTTANTSFAGVLEGLNNTISNLTINDSTEYNVGLFGQTATGSVVRDVGIVNGAVSISGSYYAGELVGTNNGAIINAYSTGSVASDSSTSGYLGGLVGINAGSIARSYSSALMINGAYVGGLASANEGTLSAVFATGALSGGGFAGGLVAGNQGTIQDAYATGRVEATGHAGGLAAFSATGSQISDSYASGSVSGPYASGLVAYNQGVLNNVYATGSVSGPFAAGLVSFNTNNISNAYASGAVSGASSGGVSYNNTGVFSNVYYDQGTTGQTVGISQPGSSQAGVTAIGGKTSLGAYAPSSYANFSFGKLNSGATWVIVDGDGTLNSSNGATRPILLSEYSTTVADAHQLQLMALNLSATYTLVANIDADGTSNPSDVWSSAGFVPVGAVESAPFSGSLEGRALTIQNLTINRPGDAAVGLFGFVSNSISDLSLVNEVVSGGGMIGSIGGGLAASLASSASLTNDSASVTLSSGGGDTYGGLVGANSGTIKGSSTTGSISSKTLGGELIGGLVGTNTGLISTSYASATISATISNGPGPVASAGGLVGYNNGVLTNVYATGAVTSGDAGGLVAINYTGGSISDAYSTGAISDHNNFDQGGIAATNLGVISSAYYDQPTTGQTVGVGSYRGNAGTQAGVTAIGGNTGLSPYAQATYVGFSFGAIGSSGWVILNGSTRPLLASEYSTSIANAHQLQLMALAPSATYTLAADVDASGTANPSDVWGPAGFVPVGSGQTPFTGGLDGQGHSVTGLTIYAPSQTDVGLIGALGPNGVARNITLSGASITGMSAVGTLVGYSSGLVSGAAGKGKVVGGSQVGGLIGYNSGMVSGSYGKASVSGLTSAASQLGGLAGYNGGVLSGDYATGAVSGNTQVGGLIGYNASQISDDYATGAVNGASGKSQAGSGSAIGGLVGESVGDILSSHATGAVTGYSQVGGLVGYTQGVGEVLSSYATGTVSGQSGQGAPSAAGTLIGGLIGESTGAMGTDDSYATGAVSGLSQVGGLIGSHDGSGVLERAYATGAVKGTSQLGGLVGYNNNEITDSYATGAVSGSSGKGALVGVNDRYGSISHSYATGKGGFGLVGVNDGQGAGELYEDYFDQGSTGTSTGVGSGPGAGVTPIGGSTDSDPHQASSYAGFDFVNTWTIQAGASRPYLIGNPQAPPPS